MSDEGNLWKVRWRKTGSKYRVFLADDTKFQVTAKTLENAIEKLEERVIAERDDVVPHFEWVNALPHPVGVEGSDFVYILCGHHRIDVESVDMLLEKPRCPSCHNYSGTRSPEPVRLATAPEGDFPFTQYGGQICSARIAEFLKLSERDDLRLLPTVVAGKETTEYLELRGTIVRQFIAKKGAPARSAFRCRECGTTLIAYLPDEADYFQFVAASSLPRPLPSVFAIGNDYSTELAISKSLRQRIIGSDDFKDVRTRKIGIVRDNLAVPADVFFNSACGGKC